MPFIYAIDSFWVFKVYETKTVLQGLKAHIQQMKKEAESECDGGVADLCTIFLRIIHNYEHKGHEYVVQRYWVHK